MSDLFGGAASEEMVIEVLSQVLIHASNTWPANQNCVPQILVCNL